MKNRLSFVFPMLCFVSWLPGIAVAATAEPSDLSTWLVNGDGSWELSSVETPNDTAFQRRNSIPTVLFNNANSQGTILTGTVEVETTTDDDFFGFVLGYDDGDLGANSTANYILIDWKQTNQSGWNAGMSISRVTGGPIASSGTDVSGDAWTHTGNVSFIERAATLGNVGWEDNTPYQFDITFNSNNIIVRIDGEEQFNIDGTFENGSFGFYNFSQPNVRYTGITEETIPPVPVPAAVWLFGSALLGFTGIAKRKRN